MATTYDLLVRGGTCVSHDGVGPADVAVSEGRIAAIGDLAESAAGEVIDAHGLHVLPGVIDTQVHFREPGGEHKEDMATGGAAAVLGGVTAVFEMPNTEPQTTDAETLADKLRRAQGLLWCDYAFFVGATEDNAERLAVLEKLPGCCGVKVFMGSSTGGLLLDDEAALRRVLQGGVRRVAVHAEDESRLRERRPLAEKGGDVRGHPEWRDVQVALRATRRLLRLSREAGRRVHVLHVSTAEEIDILSLHKDLATAEVTPQHLSFAAPHCYEEMGTLVQMNPPIRDQRHRQGLWRGVAQGVIDVIGSDHAPHTREEKARPYPQSPSGMPGVQTLLPVMLDHVNAGRLSLLRLMDLTSAGPARIYGILAKGRIAVGFDADLSLVDLGARRLIENDWIASRCGWTPFAGRQVRGWPVATVVRGHVVMREGEIMGQAQGAPVRFAECPGR